MSCYVFSSFSCEQYKGVPKMKGYLCCMLKPGEVVFTVGDSIHINGLWYQ